MSMPKARHRAGSGQNTQIWNSLPILKKTFIKIQISSVTSYWITSKASALRKLKWYCIFKRRVCTDWVSLILQVPIHNFRCQEVKLQASTTRNLNGSWVQTWVPSSIYLILCMCKRSIRDTSNDKLSHIWDTIFSFSFFLFFGGGVVVVETGSQKWDHYVAEPGLYS